MHIKGNNNYNYICVEMQATQRENEIECNSKYRWGRRRRHWSSQFYFTRITNLFARQPKESEFVITEKLKIMFSWRPSNANGFARITYKSADARHPRRCDFSFSSFESKWIVCRMRAKLECSWLKTITQHTTHQSHRLVCGAICMRTFEFHFCDSRFNALLHFRKFSMWRAPGTNAR